MKPNADCTVFHRIYVPEERVYRWESTMVSGVFWQGASGARTGKSGMVEDNETLIYIPFSSSAVLLSPEDKIIKGLVDKESPTGLTEALTITAVETFDYGSPDMQHWEVVAK